MKKIKGTLFLLYELIELEDDYVYIVDANHKYGECNKILNLGYRRRACASDELYLILQNKKEQSNYIEKIVFAEEVKEFNLLRWLKDHQKKYCCINKIEGADYYKNINHSILFSTWELAVRIPDETFIIANKGLLGYFVSYRFGCIDTELCIEFKKSMLKIDGNSIQSIYVQFGREEINVELQTVINSLISEFEKELDISMEKFINIFVSNGLGAIKDKIEYEYWIDNN